MVFYKGLGNLVYGMFYSDYYAWIKHGFLLSSGSVPLSGHLCHLISRTIQYYQTAHSGGDQLDIRLIGNPESLSSHDLFSTKS